MKLTKQRKDTVWLLKRGVERKLNKILQEHVLQEGETGHVIVTNYSHGNLPGANVRGAGISVTLETAEHKGNSGFIRLGTLWDERKNFDERGYSEKYLEERKNYFRWLLSDTAEAIRQGDGEEVNMEIYEKHLRKLAKVLKEETI